MNDRLKTIQFAPDQLSTLGVGPSDARPYPPYRPSYARHAMLRYTLRVPHRDRLLEQARQLHIPLGDWFVSPLYPVSGDLSRWDYQAGQCPVAEQACREVVNLSTDRPLSARQLEDLFGVALRGRRPRPAAEEAG